MNNYSYTRAHLNEQRVARKLQSLGYKVKALNAKKAYDITGLVDAEPILIEVKERTILWDDQYLQVSKVNSLLNHRKRILKKFPQYTEVKLSYIMSFQNTDYVFDVDDIKMCKKITRLMKKATVVSDKQIYKEVYVFPLALRKAKV